MKKFQKFMEQRLREGDEADVSEPPAQGNQQTQTPQEADPGQTMTGYTTQLQQSVQAMSQKITALLQNAQKVLAASPDYEARSAAAVGNKFKSPNHADFQAPAQPAATPGQSGSDLYQQWKQKKRPASLDEV